MEQTLDIPLQPKRKGRRKGVKLPPRTVRSVAEVTRDAALDLPTLMEQCPGLILTSLEVSRILNVPEGTLRQWRCMGVGPAYSKFGRGVRYTAKDIDLYVSKSRRVPSVCRGTQEEWRDSRKAR